MGRKNLSSMTSARGRPVFGERARPTAEAPDIVMKSSTGSKEKELGEASFDTFCGLVI